jgi:hypothetical protein
MLARMRSGRLIVSLISMLLITFACSESVNTKQLPAKTLDLLENKFMMSEVLAIAKMKGDLKNVIGYFNANSKRYNYRASRKQGEMNVEEYTVLDISSPIIGFSLFFHRTSDSLVIVDTSVNPLNREADENTIQLIKESFDSVTGGGVGSKLHFLGIYNLGGGKLLKIMVREGKSSMGRDYGIRYLISRK